MSMITTELLNNILLEQGTIRYVEPVNKITFNDDRAYVYTEKKVFRYKYTSNCRYCFLIIFLISSQIHKLERNGLMNSYIAYHKQHQYI